MDYSQKSAIVGVSLENMQKSAKVPTHIFSDIVLIDKTHSSLKLYAVKKDTLKEEDDYFELKKNGYFSIDRHSFMLVGEVTAVDKKNKIIELENQDTVSYNHLILASGTHLMAEEAADDDEFIAGLHALLEALRVRKNIPEAIYSPEIKHQRLAIKLTLEQDTLHPHFLEVVNASKENNSKLDITDKRLYEVVL